MMLSAVAPSAHHAPTASRGSTRAPKRTVNAHRRSASSAFSSTSTCFFPARRPLRRRPRVASSCAAPRASLPLAASCLRTASTSAALCPSTLLSVGSPRPRRRAAVVAGAAASSDELGGNGGEDLTPTFGGAPVEPGSPHGQMLAHVLSAEPHLFAAALEATLDRMSDDLDREEGGGSVDVESTGAGADEKKTKTASSSSADDDDRAGLVLFKRIKEMRALERRNGVQDLMYAKIIQKFLSVGVDMLPPLDEEPLILRGVDLSKLTNDVHSTEALSMVKEHLMSMLGPEASAAYSNSLVRMSKLQAAQMYAASIMFGYFLRKADKRFSLDRAMGTLPLNPMESALTLESLFNSASAMDSIDEADGAAASGTNRGRFGDADTYDVDREGNASASQDPGGGGGGGGGGSGGGGKTTTLKQYIQSFDQKALAETARIVSLEGVVLAERQTGALFGSVEQLAQEMQSALQEGDEVITTADQLMSRVQEVVGEGKVKTVTVNVATQRRVVLEAVAFGSFLRDAESYVDSHDGRLLTPASSGGVGGGGGREPPGMIGSSA